MLSKLRLLILTAKKIWFLATTDKELVYCEVHGVRTHIPITELTRRDVWNFLPNRIEHKESYYTSNGVMVKDSTAVFNLPDGMVFNLAQGSLSAGG